MKEKRLLKALGQVDADYIEEASPTQQTKRPRWMKWSVLAACLCLVVFSAINFLPHMGNEGNEGGGIPSNFTSPNSNSEQAILLLAQQDIITELQKDISDKDLQGWAEDSAQSISINFEYVLPIYAPEHITADSASLSDTLVFTNQYKAPAISNEMCIGAFTLVQHKGKWTVSMLEVGFDLETIIMQYKDTATCFLSIPQLGTEYGFLTVSDTDQTYSSITHNCQEAKTGTDLLTLLKSTASIDGSASEG